MMAVLCTVDSITVIIHLAHSFQDISFIKAAGHVLPASICADNASKAGWHSRQPLTSRPSTLVYDSRRKWIPKCKVYYMNPAHSSGTGL
jgi:hypothetical protein